MDAKTSFRAEHGEERGDHSSIHLCFTSWYDYCNVEHGLLSFKHRVDGAEGRYRCGVCRRARKLDCESDVDREIVSYRRKHCLEGGYVGWQAVLA